MPTLKIHIKSVFGSVLFEYEKEGNTIKDTLLEAIKKGANLRGANLRGANLEDANLVGANLVGANLKDANLEGANLKDANLVGANLVGANLVGAYLRDANLEDANLEDANLVVANLRGANLVGANLVGANLVGANLKDANLKDANLEGYKKDLFDVLLRAIPEIPMLKKSIVDGKIDGSTYEGDCCCLNGTICKIPDGPHKDSILSTRDDSRPIEKFFAAIKPGHTPENSQFSKLALEWIEEFESYINIAK